MIPRIGDEVLVKYLNGDSDQHDCGRAYLGIFSDISSEEKWRLTANQINSLSYTKSWHNSEKIILSTLENNDSGKEAIVKDIANILIRNNVTS